MRLPSGRALLRAGCSVVAILSVHPSWAQANSTPETVVVTASLESEIPQLLAETGTQVDTIQARAIKNGGYLDMVGAGKYRLNPVGHNLVTHKLPRGDSATNTRPRRKAVRKAKKQARK